MLEFFAEPWTGSEVLREVEISKCALNHDWSKVLPGLPNSLVVLVLDDNGILDLHPFLEYGLPKGIQKVSLLSNPVKLFREDNQEEHLLKLLDIYPQLGLFRIESEFASSQRNMPMQLFYIMIYNYRWRVLSEDASNHPIPLSLWPLVLEQAGRLTAAEGLEHHFLLFFQLLGMPFFESSLAEGENRNMLVLVRKYVEIRTSLVHTLLRKQPAIMTNTPCW
jgi:hypothetical protein